MSDWLRNPPSTYILMIFAAILSGLGALWHWDVLVNTKYNEDMTVLTIGYLVAIYGGAALLSWMLGQQLSKQLVRANRVKLVAQDGGGSIMQSFRRALTGKTYPKKQYKQNRPLNLHFYRAPVLILIVASLGIIGYFDFYMISTFFWSNRGTLLEVFLWDFALVSGTLAAIMGCSFLEYKLSIRRAPKNYAP